MASMTAELPERDTEFLSAGRIVSAVRGRVVRGQTDAQPAGVSIDTRTLPAGSLFFAVVGERFNGHDFVAQALEKGAWGAVVSEAEASRFADAPGVVIAVPDTLAALQDLASAHRARFDIPVVAVTGTNGKTTTKEMLAAILGRTRPVLKNPGNLNNHIGVPLTLLGLRSAHRAAVIEMGMSGAGEIRRLCEIARPTVGMITNVGPAHMKKLATVEEVARAKGELLEMLPPDGIAVLNGDDPAIMGMRSWVRGRSLIYSMRGVGDVVTRGVRVNGGGHRFQIVRSDGSEEIALRMPGRHNVQNALAAAAAATVLGVRLADIRAALEGFQPVAMRGEVVRLSGRQVINDSYNANPRSMTAALEMLAEMGGGGRKVAVLGDMLELGEYAREAHLEVGAAAARLKIDFLVTVGDLARHIAEGAVVTGMPEERVRAVLGVEDVVAILKTVSGPGDTILVKGSRGMQMERVLAFVEERGPDRRRGKGNRRMNNDETKD